MSKKILISGFLCFFTLFSAFGSDVASGERGRENPQKMLVSKSMGIGRPSNSGQAYDPRYRLTPDSQPSWNTFMGSANNDYCSTVAVDKNGNIYVAGKSSASWGNPINPFSGYIDKDVFVAKLNPSGVLQWNTFLGSSRLDYCWSIVVDESSNIYIAGVSEESWGSPINPHSGFCDAFIAKLNASGVLQWNTFLGSSNDDDYGEAIAVDGSGNIYIGGESCETWGTPMNPMAGLFDAFVAKLNSSGVLQWNTFLGSSADDSGKAIAVDGGGNIYVAGASNTTWGTPINPYAGYGDAFVAKLNASGVLQWNTFMGSANVDYGYALALDGGGSVYIAGMSESTWGTPVNSYSGGFDAFVAKLNASGVLQWNSFMGSLNDDYCFRLAVDKIGNSYVTGTSSAMWGEPIHPYSAMQDAFLVKLNSIGTRQWNTFLGSANVDWGEAVAVDGIGNIYIAGESYASWGSPVNGYSGLFDVFVAKISDIFLPKNDFNGDGQEDLLWRYYGSESGQGTNLVWYLGRSGGSQANTIKSLLAQSPRNPEVIDMPKGKGTETAYGDARDAKRIWERGQGEFRTIEAGQNVRVIRDPRELKNRSELRAQALSVVSCDYLPVIYNTNWKIEGVGDFNGDGKPDIVWRYYGADASAGTTLVWYMEGKNFIGSEYLPTVANANWKIDGIGDFNGDGKPDIVWRYYGADASAGTTLVWYMEGKNFIGSEYLPTVANANWKIDGIGDFNGDSKPDIVWRYYGSDASVGTTLVWYMNGKEYIGCDYLPTVANADWKIDGIGDFNGDTRPDIIWRYYGADAGLGTNLVWYMNGKNFIGCDYLPAIANGDWKIQNQ